MIEQIRQALSDNLGISSTPAGDFITGLEEAAQAILSAIQPQWSDTFIPPTTEPVHGSLWQDDKGLYVLRLGKVYGPFTPPQTGDKR